MRLSILVPWVLAIAGWCVVGVLLAQDDAAQQPSDVTPPATILTEVPATPQVDAPRLEGTPPVPSAPEPAPGQTPEAALRMAGDVRDAFMGEIRTRDQRIRDLEETVETLQAALPRAGIVQELSSASVEELEGLQVAMRHVAETKLLGVSPLWSERYAFMTQSGEAGVARILPRGRFETLIAPRGGGAYYSFATQSHSYNDEPDLQLAAGRYDSGFAGGNDGWFLDLGDVPIEEIEADAARPPVDMPRASLDTWNFLWTERPPLPEPSDGRRRRDTFVRDMATRAGELKLSRSGVEAVADHTYLLRAILPREHDHLVVFRDLGADAHGRTLVWRVLKSWEVPRRR